MAGIPLCCYSPMSTWQYEKEIVHQISLLSLYTILKCYYFPDLINSHLRTTQRWGNISFISPGILLTRLSKQALIGFSNFLFFWQVYYTVCTNLLSIEWPLNDLVSHCIKKSETCPAWLVPDNFLSSVNMPAGIVSHVPCLTILVECNEHPCASL